MIFQSAKEANDLAQVQVSQAGIAAQATQELSKDVAPVLEALKAMDQRLTAFEAKQTAIEAKQDAAAERCCIVM